MTMRYSHLAPSQEREAVSLIKFDYGVIQTELANMRFCALYSVFLRLFLSYNVLLCLILTHNDL